MGYFKLKVYHGRWFSYHKGLLQYVGGQTTAIEDIDYDRWSLFEAYAELKKFGYVEENISALWFKDPIYEDMEKNLKLFKSDANSIAICKIDELKEHVELFVVHKIEENNVFLDAGYINVREDQGIIDKVDRPNEAGQNQPEPSADVTGAESRDSDEDDHHEAEFANVEKDDSTDDLYFTDSEDELDPDISGFEDVNVMIDKYRNVKKKGVATENFKNDEGADIDELELDHEVGVGANEDGENDGLDSDNEGLRYPVHRAQKYMKQYKWEIKILYASQKEFKDTVTAYAVQTTRAITFKKCDLKRVRVVCSGECLFWLYTVKMEEEDTWTKQIALDEIQGTFREQYKRIYDYEHELLRANLGSSVHIQIRMRLERRSRSAGDWRPYWSAAQKYEVVNGLEKFVVDIVGHKKGRCPKPIKEVQQSKKPNKGKKKNSSTNSHPPAAKGGRKTTSSYSIAKIGVKRKTTSVTQPLSSTQSNSATQPKRPRGRPKGTTKPNCSAQEAPQPKKHPSPKSSASSSFSTQPNTKSLLASQSILSTSSTQPPVQHKHTVRQTSRQPVGQFSIKNSGAPHVSP
ncbi:hypothetical protein Ahy_B08g090099 [Arachis hypogaea]|uniref:PB1-like domain-containing protein n=1 Tax=Arachis hypogaea TaxID=3818 RepID=A0A444XZK2_ARAHY|nr:hypothetical protein Ahy_B08g090099 [Arachis hypogaea]